MLEPESREPAAYQPTLFDRHGAAGADTVRAVQRRPAVSARDDIAASNRLIELLAGPLGEPGRAMVELRRLIDRHPGTDAAARAKLVLAELKEQVPGGNG